MQRNWEIEDIFSRKAELSAEKLKKALDWIKFTPEINEVLITGGEPLFLSNSRLRKILADIAANPRIERIRIGTRTPVTHPSALLNRLSALSADFIFPVSGKSLLLPISSTPMKSHRPN